MYNTKVIRMLKGLSKNEMNDLKHFIEPPFLANPGHKSVSKTVSRKKLVQFYKILKTSHPQFSKRSVERKIVFEKMFPGERYDDKKFRNIKYAFIRIIENYLSFIDYARDPFDHELHLINQLAERKLDGIFESKVKSANELIDACDEKNEDYYLRKCLLTRKERSFHENRMALGKSEINFKRLKMERDYVTIFFLQVALTQLIMIQHAKRHLSLNIDTEFYDSVIKYLNLHPVVLDSNIALLILYKFISLYTISATPGEIRELRNLLSRNEKSFKRADFQFLYIELLSICINHFLNGDNSFKDLVFDLIKDCIEKGVYIQDGFMHEHNFTSIVSLALRLKQTKWAEEFMVLYKDRLLPEVRENAYLFNYASFLYVQKDYNRALEFLSRVKSKDFYDTTSIYNLQLRIYFETGALESALNLIDSYKHFISKGKLIPGDYKTRQKNFLHFYEKIVKIKMGFSRILPEEVILELDGTPDVEFRGWLSRKFRELENDLTNY